MIWKFVEVSKTLLKLFAPPSRPRFWAGGHFLARYDPHHQKRYDRQFSTVHRLFSKIQIFFRIRIFEINKKDPKDIF